MKTGMPVLYDNPLEVGADRIVNGVAAYERTAGAVIVVDFGTATTFDAISSRGGVPGRRDRSGPHYLGRGAFPARRAACPVSTSGRPPRVIGKNTTHSLQSGLFHGYAGLVSGILTPRPPGDGGAGTEHRHGWV